MTQYKVLLVGSGGVGTVASVALEKSGEAQVTSVLRRDYDHVVKNGFRIESPDYGHLEGWRPSKIANSIENAVELNNGEPFDYIVVCTKVLPEVQRTEELIAKAVTPGKTKIVLIQNGIDIERPVADRFPDNVVLSGVTMIGVTNYNGHVKQFEHDYLSIGYFASGHQPESVQEAEAKEFIRVYGTCNKHAKYIPDLVYARWRKLVYNSTLNTVCALTQLDTTRLYLCGIDEAVVLPAMLEIKAIAEKAMGKSLPEDIEKFMLSADDGLFYKPSMQVDEEKGNPMELEAILGNPLRIARDLGVPAPTLNLVYHLLRGVQYRLLEKRGDVTTPEDGSRKSTKPIWPALL